MFILSRYSSFWPLGGGYDTLPIIQVLYYNIFIRAHIAYFSCYRLVVGYYYQTILYTLLYIERFTVLHTLSRVRRRLQILSKAAMMAAISTIYFEFTLV